MFLRKTGRQPVERFKTIVEGTEFKGTTHVSIKRFALGKGKMGVQLTTKKTLPSAPRNMGYIQIPHKEIPALISALQKMMQDKGGV